MAPVRVSVEAENDIDQITAYTIQTWGAQQADRYLSQLEETFALLAATPSMGRSSHRLRSGLRRFEVGSHVVFYLPEPDGILVVRVLHQSMLPTKHL